MSENETNGNGSGHPAASPALEDADRLPWLETGEDYEESDGSVWRTLGIILGLVVLIAFIVGLIYWIQNRDGGIEEGSGEVIAAPEGDYKVKPDDPEGREFEGEGDVAQATAEGRADNEVSGSRAPASKAGGETQSQAKGSGLVQLGAFGEKQGAENLWSALSSRYDYLSSYEKSVTSATIEGSRVYRLNAVTSDEDSAEALCNKLKKAGVSCLIPQ